MLRVIGCHPMTNKIENRNEQTPRDQLRAEYDQKSFLFKQGCRAILLLPRALQS